MFQNSQLCWFRCHVESANGAAFASITEISKIQKTIVEEEGISEVEVAEVEVSEHRVFLLGENRWEEPSRLTGRIKTKSNDSKIKCLSCRGEGRLLCSGTHLSDYAKLYFQKSFINYIHSAYCSLSKSVKLWTSIQLIMWINVI